MRTSLLPIPLLLVSFGHYAIAQSGTLDPAFGNDGIVTTAVGSSSSLATGLAVQTNGQIVVVGRAHNGSNNDFAVVRYNLDGSLDATFSADGKVTTAIGEGDDLCYALAIQTDGKILLTGHSFGGNDLDFALVRYNTDGSLDSTLGLDGKVTTAIGGGFDRACAIALQSDGRIVAAGTSFNGTHDAIAVVRYNADGSLDGTFSSDGKLTTDVGSDDDQGFDVAVQPGDGKILVTGLALFAGDLHIALVRYLTDGSLDNSFGLNGMVTTALGTGAMLRSSIVLQPDGKILVGSTVTIDGFVNLTVLRYNIDGTLDNTFGIDGVVTTLVGVNYGALGTCIALQADGKILVAGMAYTGTDYDFAIARFDMDGTLDTTFGSDGSVITWIGPGSNDGIEALALQPNGRILVAGSTNLGGSTRFAVARYISGMNIGVAEFTMNATTALICPNPIADEAVLEYELATAGELTCEMFDAKGRAVHTLFANVHRAGGQHRETLDLSGLAAGQYTLVLSNGVGKVSVRVVKQ